jgi:diguanylate cyclase (GGDEF)-like protein
LINLISYQWAEMMTSLSSMLFCPVALTVGIISYRRGFPGARYFLLAWTILLFGSISLAARNFGLLPTNFITVNGFQIGSSIEMLLLSFALADRINVLKREKALADARLLRAQQENIAALKESELMLEKRVAERTCELAEANARLESLSRQDPLTGLGNRNELEDAWRKLASRSERYNEKIGLLLLDLNNFKPINDNHGHNAGDRVLQEVATRLRKVVRTSDIVVRLGGDEFVVLFGDIATNSDLDAFKIKIADAISAPIEVDSNRLVVGASIGSAIYPIDAMTLTELLRQADAAMYQNKMQQGAGR